MNEMSLFISEEEEKKRNLVHYEGELGVFDYDPREFRIERLDDFDYLHYHGSGKSIDLPDGCINTRYMFSYCGLPKGFTLGEHFNTSKVTCMESMFLRCNLKEGFSLGECFDTSNVTNMENMFQECVLPRAFSLGEHFDTSNVTDMCCMFESCGLPEGFSLGECFDTSRVTDMYGMFEECELPKDFTLGEHFDTSNVTDMRWMFEKCMYGDYYVYDYLETESDDEIIEKLKLQSTSLSNEAKSIVRQDLIPLEIGYGILERLHIQVEYSEEKALALSLGEQYVDYCKAVSSEAPARISDVSTIVVPLKFVEFVMTKMKCNIPFGSNVLILRDFLDQYNIKLELYRGMTYTLYDEVYREHAPLYVGDFISYCDSFIHICSVEKTTDDCKQNVGQLLSYILDRVPTVFSAGYMYRSEYDLIDEDSNLLYLPEKLRDRYKETMGAVDINSVVGCCEDAITMATFPKDLERYPGLKRLKERLNDESQQV